MRHLRSTVVRLLAQLAIAVSMLTAALADDAGAAEIDQRLRLSNLRVSGGETLWHPENDFELDWDLPTFLGGLTTINAVDYLVRDSSGAAAGPVVHTAGALEGIRVFIPFAPGQFRAAPGRYTVEVWLEGSTGEGPRRTATLLFDDARPASARPLSPAAWIRAGTNAVLKIEHPAMPQPVSGIRGYAVLLDHGSDGSPCAGPDGCTDAETDLHAGIDDDSVSLGPLAEGINVARVVAVSGSGKRSALTESADLRVDGTRPEVTLAGAPEAWSNGPIRLTAVATDTQSGMAPAGAAGPFTAISIDGGTPTVAAGGSVMTIARGNGVHPVSFYARDAVGNLGDGEPASTPADSTVVRIDEQPPRVAFRNSQDPYEPERIEATISDALSGPGSARGSILVRASGTTGAFDLIPTRLSDGKLTGIWDSDAYPAGSYEFRATGYDSAGNLASTARRSNGTRMVLANPIKRPATLEFGFGGRQMVWHRCARARGELRCRREVIGPFERRPAVRTAQYGRGMPVGGKLISAAESPLAGLKVELIETFAAGSKVARRTTMVETNADGTFLARLAPGPTRDVEVSFAGDRVLTRALSRSLHMSVPTAVRLRASAPTAAVGGAPVVFSGRIAHAEAAIPAAGRPVQLEFRLPDRPWSEFRTVQTDASGHFRYAYSFSDDDSRGVRFQFRAYAPPQPGWPYDPAASKPVAVTGR